MQSPVITAINISRKFGTGDTAVTAVKDVNLKVKQGEFLAITGRSGSGKTTLLNLLGGLDQPTHGQILLQNQDLSDISDPEMVKNGTFASPAIALANKVLPVPGDPTISTPLGI